MAKGDKLKSFLSKGNSEAQYIKRQASIIDKRNMAQLLDSVLAAADFHPYRYLAAHEAMSVAYAPGDESQFTNWMLNECNSPILLARHYLNALNAESTLQSANQAIGQYIGQTTEESFRRFGDVNCIDSAFRRSWISKSGLPLDVMAIDISQSSGYQLGEQDLVDFMLSYPNGKRQYRQEQLSSRIEQAFYQLTGQKLVSKYARILLSEVDQFISKEAAPF